MSSTLLCRSSARATVVELKLESAVSTGNQGGSRSVSLSTTGSSKTIQVAIWAICLVIVLSSLQCIETKHLRFESKEGLPCLCNQTFYQSCPKADQCRENEMPANRMAVRGRIDEDDTDSYDPPLGQFPFGDHDTQHPDHVDKTYLPTSRFPSDYDYQEREQVVRHRKVYVAKKSSEPVIHPIKLTIPVKLPEMQSLPEPKPVYKLRKYTTYENRPEIKMVPVTKTIIKPAGIGPDQIINSDSLDFGDEFKRKSGFDEYARLID